MGKEHIKINEEKLSDKYLSRKIIESMKNGIVSGLKTTWMLTKIIVPVYFLITFLKYTPVLDWISNFLSPIMQIFGLPGEASVVLVFGNVINLSAALAAVASLSLTAKEITIIAVMLSFSHSLFMETAVAKKTGLNVYVVIMIRFTLAVFSGIMLNVLL